MKTRWEHPEYFLVSANIMNQPSLSWVHHHLGVVKPYLPEYLPGVSPAKAEPKGEFHPRDEHPKGPPAPPPADKAPQHPPTKPADKKPAVASSSAANPSATPLFPKHPTNWRASLLPPWEGPANFTADKDYVPQTIPHRWLPLPQGGVLDGTPIMATEYGAFTPALWHWTLAAQEHYSFLEHLEQNELWRYKFHKWDYYYKRLGIQFMAIMGRDINMAKPL